MMLAQAASLTNSLAKGFCAEKFWAKFTFWRGAVRGEVFGKVFGLVLLGHSEQKKLQPRLQPESPAALRSKAGEKSRQNFLTRFCRGTPAKS